MLVKISRSLSHVMDACIILHSLHDEVMVLIQFKQTSDVVVLFRSRNCRLRLSPVSAVRKLRIQQCHSSALVCVRIDLLSLV